MKERVLEDDVRLKRVERQRKRRYFGLLKSRNVFYRLNLVYAKYQGRNNQYAAKFFLCEIINLMNIIFQIFYINKFIGGKFLDYGSRIFAYNQHIDTNIDPMDDVFPKITKCQFNRHGPGGDINVSNADSNNLDNSWFLEPRCPLSTSSEHCEWEDLPGDVDVDDSAGGGQLPGRPVQDGLRNVSPIQNLHAVATNQVVGCGRCL